MKALLLAVGRLKAGPERELVERYSKRLTGTGKSAGLTGLDTIEMPESRAAQPEARMAQEAEGLLARLPDKAFLVAFDERGKAVGSEAFASEISDAMDAGRVPAFVIGGPDGLDPQLRERADRVVSFGKLTIPHQIVRALVVEQLYRATTILAGHPYHRS